MVKLRDVCDGLISPPKGKKSNSGVRKVVERDPARWSYLNGDVGTSRKWPNFGKQILVSLVHDFPSLSLSLVHLNISLDLLDLLYPVNLL